MDGETIRGVITERKSGRQTILAKRVIDATGDADIANFAGSPFAKAPKEELMEVTTNFSYCNVDLPKFVTYVAGVNRTMADWTDEDCGKEKDMFSTRPSGIQGASSESTNRTAGCIGYNIPYAIIVPGRQGRVRGTGGDGDYLSGPGRQ